MTETKTRAKIKELHAVAVQWAARAMRDADEGRHMDAQQNMRRANEVRFQALKLEQSLTTA